MAAAVDALASIRYFFGARGVVRLLTPIVAGWNHLGLAGWDWGQAARFIASLCAFEVSCGQTLHQSKGNFDQIRPSGQNRAAHCQAEPKADAQSHPKSHHRFGPAGRAQTLATKGATVTSA
jgi:hypothetical protein